MSVFPARDGYQRGRLLLVGAPERDPRRRAGLLLLVGGLLALTLAIWRPNPFASTATVRARFADTAGLARIGSEVRIAGTPAGKVVARERDGRDAVVTMELDDDAGAVHTDATAELRPRLLFEGTAFVDLEPGSPAARELGDRTLPLSQTRTAVSVAVALGVLDAPTRAAFQTTARELRRTRHAAPALNDSLAELPAVTRDAATVADAARGADHDGLRRAVAGFARTSRAVAARRDDLVPFARGMARTAAAATRTAPSSRDGRYFDHEATSVALDRDLAELPATAEAVRTGAGAASRVLDELDPLARDLRPTARKLGPTLDAVRPLLRSAAPVLRETGPLVSDARATLRDAARAAPGARRVLRAADPTLRTLQTTLLGALERKTALGTPAYLAFLGLFAGGGGASRPFIGDEGHFMRFGFRFLTGAGRPAPPCSLLATVSPQLASSLNQAGICQT